MSQSFCLQSPDSDGHDRSQQRGSEMHGFPRTAPAPALRAVLEFNTTLVSCQDPSNMLASFRVRPDEVPSAEASWFEPGQYTAFGLRDGDGRNDRALLRPYSKASPPEERRRLELYLRRGFVAANHHLRRWLGVADRVPASLFFEPYDTAPIFPAEQLEPLRQVLLARSR